MYLNFVFIVFILIIIVAIVAGIANINSDVYRTTVNMLIVMSVLYIGIDWILKPTYDIDVTIEQPIQHIIQNDYKPKSYEEPSYEEPSCNVAVTEDHDTTIESAMRAMSSQPRYMSADTGLAHRQKIMAERANQSILNNHLSSKNNWAKYYEEEMRQNENRHWWENSNYEFRT